MDTNTDETFGWIQTNNLWLLNTVAYNTAQDIKLLDDQILKLNDHLGRLNVSINSGIEGTSAYYHQNNEELKNAYSNGKTSETAFGNLKHYVEMASSVGEIAESGLKIWNAVEELPPAVEKIKKGAELFNNVMKALKGVEALTKTGEIAEGAVEVGSIMAGSESIAASASLFGPWGWAVGALIAGGTAAILINEPKQEDKQQTFADNGLKNNNKYLLNAQRINVAADDYITMAEIPKPKSAMQILQDADELKKNLLRHGGSITFDWKRAEGSDPVYLQGLFAAMNANNKMESKAIKQLQFSDTLDLVAFRKKFDTYTQFPLASLPEKKETLMFIIPDRADGPGMLIPYTKSISRKEYEKRLDKEANAKFAASKSIQNNVLKKAVENYLLNGFEYVQKEYHDKLNLLGRIPGMKDSINSVWERFLNVRKSIDRDKNHGRVTSVGNRNLQVEGGARRNNSIVINLNKPMIENFTINTGELKDGINDFKHKVEEVLLEILKSANVIH